MGKMSGGGGYSGGGYGGGGYGGGGGGGYPQQQPQVVYVQQGPPKKSSGMGMGGMALAGSFLFRSLFSLLFEVLRLCVTYLT